MPIASGALNWPKTYWSKPPKRPGVHSRVIVVDRDDPPDVKNPSVPSSPQVTYRNPPSPRPSYRERTPSPPPMTPDEPSIRRTIVEQRMRYDDPGPPPRQIPPERPPSPPHVTSITRQHYDVPPAPRMTTTRVGRYGGPRGTSYDRYQNGYNYYDSQPREESYCCGNRYFNTGKAGGDTGCCQGGMFSNRRYPYGAEDFYQMPGDGRRRCCATIWGIIAGLLLLGLLIGLLAGLMPALQKQNAQSAVSSQYPNGQYYNGIYYYPVTNPPDVYYLNLGPGVPCNKYNNNSATRAPVTAATVTKNTATAATITTRTTLIDCNQISTAYVQVQGISQSTTTVSWAQQFPNKAVSIRCATNALFYLLLATITAAAFLKQ